MQPKIELAINKLKERGVSLHDIAEITFKIQQNYQNVTIEDCLENVNEVISKSETIYTILTGIAIDEAVEKKYFDPEINHVINTDEGLYGLDEILALSIVNMNGSIALTNFGYLDKTKLGIIGKLDKLGKENDACHTFLDDIVCAIAASAASRIAHSNRK